ncbi:nucleotidyltransferase domain-containing protein [Thermococcus atlanticus]
MLQREELLKILREVKLKLQEILGDDLVEVVLFGSYARGEAREDSDVDVLVVVRRWPNREKEWEIGELMTDLVLRYGVVFSLITYPEKPEMSHDPLIINATREGVKI